MAVFYIALIFGMALLYWKYHKIIHAWLTPAELPSSKRPSAKPKIATDNAVEGAAAAPAIPQPAIKRKIPAKAVPRLDSAKYLIGAALFLVLGLAVIWLSLSSQITKIKTSDTTTQSGIDSKFADMQKMINLKGETSDIARIDTLLKSQGDKINLLDQSDSKISSMLADGNDRLKTASTAFNSRLDSAETIGKDLQTRVSQLESAGGSNNTAMNDIRSHINILESSIKNIDKTSNINDLQATINRINDQLKSVQDQITQITNKMAISSVYSTPPPYYNPVNPVNPYQPYGTVDIANTYGDTDYGFIYTPAYYSQLFTTPPTSSLLSVIRLNLVKIDSGDYGNLRIDMGQSTDGIHLSGQTTYVFPTSQIPVSLTGMWVTIPIDSPIILAANTQYAISISSATIPANKVAVRINSNSTFPGTLVWRDALLVIGNSTTKSLMFDIQGRTQ